VREIQTPHSGMQKIIARLKGMAKKLLEKTSIVINSNAVKNFSN
jgi:hypothetical protein